MFIPKRVIFEKGARDYPLGEELYQKFKQDESVSIFEASTNQVKKHIPGEDLPAQYKAGKQTLVVGVKKSLKFQSCKPSAHYQLPLVSGCMGQCEYCYLNTQLGDKPFVRVHVNLDEIIGQADKYVNERLPDITWFEGAATSDPLPVEPYTRALEKCIVHFGKSENSRFRFVSKYNYVDNLLDLPHNGHTEIRFSLNTPYIIKEYEHYTAPSRARITACSKLAARGYTVGFIIAPVFIYPGWKEDYLALLQDIRENFPTNLVSPLMFEVISHRYTARAKVRINEIFPSNSLPMTDEERTFKFGQFGYGKYVYTKEEMREIKEFFLEHINAIFPNADLKYII